MNSAQTHARTIQPGDQVLLRVVVGKTESFLLSTVLDTEDPRGIHIKFVSPNEDDDAEDWVDANDLTLSSEAEDKVTFKDRAATGLKYGIPVIPLRGKAPFTQDWPSTATTDPFQIEQWNTEFPDANCGMVAKSQPGGFWCLEVDSTDVGKRYKKDTGNSLPSNTLVVQSRPGRGHRWYRHNAASIAMGNLGQNDVLHKDFSVRAHNQQAVAPGSIHPESGVEYTLIRDVEPTEAPAELIAWLLKQKASGADKPKNTSTANPSAIAEAPIPAGSRNASLASLGGRWHHSGASDKLVLEALLEANDNRCVPPLSVEEVKTIAKSVCRYDTSEDVQAGVNLNGAKVQAIAEASIVNIPEDESSNIEVLERASLPIVEYPDPGNDDYVSLFAKDLVSGTSVPLAYVREPLKYMVNHLLDGHFFHPAYPDLSLCGNHFSIGESESAKTKGFDFAKAWMKPQFEERGFVIKSLLAYKSEALLVKSLSREKDRQGRSGNPNQFLYITEGAELAAKKNNDHFQEVFAKIMELYDQREAETGSLTNGLWHATDVKISTVMCFTPDSFRQTYGSKGSIGSGGLGRFTMSSPAFAFMEGDWERLPNSVLEKTFNLLRARLPSYGSPAAFLIETPEATKIRLDAKKYFYGVGKLGKRILEGFVKEQVNRAVMSVNQPNIMTGADAERIYDWAKGVVEARGKCWPADAGNNVEQMEIAIRRAVFNQKHRVSEATLKNSCNYYRAGSGGAWAFHGALANLKKSDIKWTGITRKGTALYCLKTCHEHPNLDDLSKPELKELLKSAAAA